MSEQVDIFAPLRQGDPFASDALALYVDPDAKAKKKKAAQSPTRRSLEHLRKLGMLVAVVERWNPHAGIRQDLWGCLDIIALAPDGVTWGIQTTSGSNVAARVTKIAECPALIALRKCRWKLVVHGWTKGKDGRYKLREVDVS